MDKFRAELEALLNRYSMENGSDTPDFILAQFIYGCLKSFNETIKARDQWYGHGTSLNSSISRVVEDAEVYTEDPTNFREARYRMRDFFEDEGFLPGSLFQTYLCNVAMVLYDTIGIDDKATRDDIAEKILRLIFWD